VTTVYPKSDLLCLAIGAQREAFADLQERYYNLLCLAVGTQRRVFADLEAYLPKTRSQHCVFEYQRLVHAFAKAIIPHIDRERAKQVLDMNWLESLGSKPASSNGNSNN